LRRAAWVFLLATWLGLVRSAAGLAASNTEVPVAGPDPSYRKVVATHLKQVLKHPSTYDSFEISDPRWVNSINGWTWLTCVRFHEWAEPGPEQTEVENSPNYRPQDRIHSYALFLDGDKVVDGRFAVQTDNCNLQTYYPFQLWPSPATYKLIFPRKRPRSTSTRSP
jgi:hypothetical protein